MGKFLSNAVIWFQGKKTILGGILVIAAVAAGEWYGKIDASTALAIGGVGFAAVGLGDKANRHQAELLTAVRAIGQAGIEARSGNSAGAMQTVESAAESIGAPILNGYVASIQPPPAASASFHITADSKEELVEHLQALGKTLVGTAPADIAPTSKAAIA